LHSDGKGFAVYGVNGIQTIAFASGVAIEYGIVPRFLVDRKAHGAAFISRRVKTHERIEISLRHQGRVDVDIMGKGDLCCP